MHKKVERWVSIIIALCIGGTAGFLSYSQAFRTVDQVVTNWFYDHGAFYRADNRITVIAIDADTEKQYGEYESWSRELLADAVNRLTESHAAVIGLDISLSKRTGDETGDKALVEACSEAGNVIAVASAVYDTSHLSEKERSERVSFALENGMMGLMNGNPETGFMDDDNIMYQLPADAKLEWKEQKIVDLLQPFDALLSEVTIGVENAAQQSEDGVIRRAAFSVNFKNQEYDSFAAAVYKTFQGKQGLDYTIPEGGEQGLFGFQAMGRAQNYQIISFSDLLAGTYDSSWIEGDIVLIGRYQASQKNNLQWLMNPNIEQQQVLMQASIVQALLNQRTTQYVSKTIQAILYAVAIAFTYWIAAVRKKRWTILLVDAFLLFFLLNFFGILDYLGYRVLMLIPLVFVVVVVVTALLQRLLFTLIEQKRVEHALRVYVGSQVAKEITEKTPLEMVHANKRKNIAVLFVDIRGFTTISETMEPEQVVKMLNLYLTEVSTAIANWNGTLDKFIGDAAMAFFNAPQEQENYVLHAVCAAAEIIRRVEKLHGQFMEQFHQDIQVGVGINCGDAIVGNIGSLARMDYTAIGDAVNVASRLESQAAPGQILVSRDVWEATQSYVSATRVGELRLKGKMNGVEAWQIDQILELPSYMKPSRKLKLLDPISLPLLLKEEELQSPSYIFEAIGEQASAKVSEMKEQTAEILAVAGEQTASAIDEIKDRAVSCITELNESRKTILSGARIENQKEGDKNQ